MKRKQHGIFCLEGDWYNDFNQSSTVKPVLKLLSQGVGVAVPHIHRDVATIEEFTHYCRKWRQSGVKRYPILYLAFHGESECLFVGDQRKRDRAVSLDQLAEILGSGLGGRMVHFGSCETLATDRRNIQRFLQKTGAVAVTGFKGSVDWLYSSVFDVLLFEGLLRQTLTIAGVRKAERTIWNEHRPMCKKLDFRMVVRDPRRRA